HLEGSGHDSSGDPREARPPPRYRGGVRRRRTRVPHRDGTRPAWARRTDRASFARPRDGLHDDRRDPRADPERRVSDVLVDSNVLLDVATADARWGAWA